MKLAANKVPNTRIHEKAAGLVILGLANVRYILFHIDKHRYFDSDTATVIRYQNTLVCCTL